jgi:hypothetical protein
MSTNDISELIRSLWISIPPEAVADLGAFNDEFRQLRSTPAGKSRIQAESRGDRSRGGRRAKGSSHSAQQAGTCRPSIV